MEIVKLLNFSLSFQNRSHWMTVLGRLFFPPFLDCLDNEEFNCRSLKGPFALPGY
jgi:hypothetical protein